MIADLPVCVSMAIIAYQDFKNRLVDDWAFLPSLIFFPLALLIYPHILTPVIVKALIMGLLGLLVYKLGLAAQADAIILPLLTFSTGALSPLPSFVGAGIVGLTHISYVFLKRGSKGFSKIVSVEDALKDDKWIPRKVILGDVEEELPMPPEKAWDKLREYRDEKAEVLVSFGTPLAGYFALGYLGYFLLRLFVPSI